MHQSTHLDIGEKSRKPCHSEIGTGIAINEINKSGAYVDGAPSRSNWGGARNRADRVTFALAYLTAQNIIRSAYRAKMIGLPFNRFVTIHFERAGLADKDAAAAIGKLMKLATDWIRRQGRIFTYAWVRENDAGDGSKGSHVHILCHCPDTIPIGRMWQRWLRNVTGRPYRAKAIKSKRIGGTLNAHATTPAVYLQNLDRVLAYICKGVSKVDTGKLGLPRHQAGGSIIGKRAGWSQNVGAKSRVLAGGRANLER